MATSASSTTGTEPGSTARGANALDHAPAQDPMAQLLAVLATDRPVGYSANLARVAGDAKAGLLLSQLMYWTRVGTEIEPQGGWISKTREQWTLETGLSRCEQESARLTLLELGLIEEARVGMPARLAFRVRLGAVSTSLARLLNSEPVQWSLFDVRSNADQVRALLGRSMAFYRVYTEITGSVVQAVFLARAMQAQKSLGNGGHSDWFTFSPGAWAIETGLSAAQLRLGKQKMCQFDFIEQAMMQYPKRRTVLRMRLNEVTSAILRSRLNRMNDGKPASGLLRMIGGNTATQDSAERKIAVTFSAPKKSTSKATPAKSHQQGNSTPKASFEGGSPIWLSVSLGNTPPFWRTKAETGAKQASNASFEESADLDGGFSQAVEGQNPPSAPAVCEIPPAGNSTSGGRFSHASWQDLAALHAGARILTTKEETTPPPTPSASPLAAPGPTGGGGGVDRQNPQTGVGAIGRIRFAPPALNGTGSVGNTGQQATPSSSQPLPAPSAPQFVWPDLPEALLVAVQRLVTDHRIAKTLSPQRMQLLLDELASVAARGAVKSPTAYLGSMLSKEAAGTLDLAAGYEWQARREASAKLLTASHAKTYQLHKTSQQAQQLNHSVQNALSPAATATVTPHPEASRVWQQCLDQLHARLDTRQVQLWLNPLVPVDLCTDAATLTLLCSSRFKLDSIKTNYLAHMNEALRSHLDAPSASCLLVTSFNKR